MGGGGSQGSGKVEYADGIMEAWGAQMRWVGQSVEQHAANFPNSIAADSMPDLLIDPNVFYGATIRTSGDALQTYGTLPLTATFNSLLAETQPNTDRVVTLRGWLDSLWGSLANPAYTATLKNSLISAFATRLADKINTDVMPTLDVGLRNTNSVLSSSIFMAKAAIWDGYEREVSDYSAKVDFEILGKQYAILDTLLRQEASLMQALTVNFDLALRRMAIYLDVAKTYMATQLSLNDTWWQNYVKSRVVYVEDQIRTETWYNEMLEYNNKAMASLSGGAVISTSKINAAAAMVSGGMSGAAAGAMVGAKMGAETGSSAGYWGAGIGAIVGALGGYLSAQ